MNILITGGAGYLGSLMVLKLQEHGHQVIVLDNLSRGKKEFVFTDKFYCMDISDKKAVKEILAVNNIDLVMHFASFIEAGESMIDPGLFFNNNSMGSLQLLDAMVETDVKYFIFSSTAAVYGYPESIPIPETASLQPVNVYGETKLIVEKILSWYNRIYGLNYISLRYFNACGAEEQYRTGECHNPETHLIPLALKTALGKKDKLLVFGTDYKTKDGTCIRDYIHVCDLLDAHLLAVDYLIEAGKSDVFNLGSETGHSVKEIIDIVKKVTKKDFPVEKTSRRPGDPDILIASSDKIRKILNWKRNYTDMEKIIYTAYQWEINRNDKN